MANFNTDWSPAAVVDKFRDLTGAEVASYKDAALNSVEGLRTALAAISGTTYSAAKLDVMTKNDMLYAWRIESGLGPQF